MKYDIIIVGGGAAGLCAALEAARAKEQLHILVIEKESVCGRKLSASGNGKCNLTNAIWRAECYYSENAEFIHQWTAAHDYHEIIEFFRRFGIPVYEKNGYYYPVSNQAKQVTTLLVDKCREEGVEFLFQTEVTAIHKRDDKECEKYEVITSKSNRYQSDSVILSTGGAATPKLGGTRSGYNLAKSLQHRVIPDYPVLSPIYLEEECLKLAKGVRLEGIVTLQKPDGTIWKESGQIQFNENNLSGIVMMNLSCHLPYMEKEEMVNALHIDCLPDWSWNALKELLLEQCHFFPNESVKNLLQGIFPAGFVYYFLKRLRIPEENKVSDLTEKQLNRIVSNCKKLCFTPLKKKDYDKAQVTAGGVQVKEIDVHTFESRKHRNLYLTGELLDINGICGGYNLTFAMLSGIQAAKEIIRKKHCIYTGGTHD